MSPPISNHLVRHADVIVIGAGLAGLTVALEVANERKVILLSKGDLNESASAWAQGGIVGVLDQKDSYDSHVRDTLEAGAGIVIESVARLISEKSQQAIQCLLHLGVKFTQDPLGPLGLHLTREGGHTHRRVIHAEDSTGKAIQEVLLAKAKQHCNIQIFEHCVAIDLILHKHLCGQASQDFQTSALNNRCYGVYALNILDHQVISITAQDVVLATGGVGKVYQHSTNPNSSTGDGIAMAWRAGCRVANMEFIQFHPTFLYHPQESGFLITEALRGEGAYLRLPNGHRFMGDHDPRLELAPRDIVTRAIDKEMKRYGLQYVLLDATHLGAEVLKERFPTILKCCLAFGIDMTKEAIPVVPSAHYTCGGVVTNVDGQTDVQHLFSVGESAYTGLHGANRLASNSLLECVVMGKQAVKKILEYPIEASQAQVKLWSDYVVDDDEKLKIALQKADLQTLMWHDVGIVRTTHQLERAHNRIELIKKEFHQFSKIPIDPQWIEFRNLLICAELIVLSALDRKESRGLHYIRDYATIFAQSSPTILKPNCWASIESLDYP